MDITRRIPGDLLLRGLRMLVLPLVMTSLILGLAGNSRGKFNKQAGIAILYYLATTLLAAIIGKYHRSGQFII